MGALLDGIQKQITALGQQQSETRVRALQADLDFAAAIELLVQAREKLEKDPELETLYLSIGSMNVLPQPGRR